jgi:hypothetical protein
MLLKTNHCGSKAAGGHDILSPKKLKNKEQFLIRRGEKRELFSSPSVMVRRLFNSFVV